MSVASAWEQTKNTVVDLYRKNESRDGGPGLDRLLFVNDDKGGEQTIGVTVDFDGRSGPPKAYEFSFVVGADEAAHVQAIGQIAVAFRAFVERMRTVQAG